MTKRKKRDDNVVLEDQTQEMGEETLPEAAPSADGDAPAEVIASEASAATEVTAPVEVVEDQEQQTAELQEQLELARQEAAENKDNWLRAVAELSNFRRRQDEQLKLQRDRIKGEMLQGVLSALDDMDLAFQNVPEELNGQLVGWVEGFRLVQRKLDKILEEQSVAPISTEGEFDPNLHEAVSYEEREGHSEGEIIAEVRKGYRIGNRVLRPALVRVAKAIERQAE